MRFWGWSLDFFISFILSHVKRERIYWTSHRLVWINHSSYKCSCETFLQDQERDETVVKRDSWEWWRGCVLAFFFYVFGTVSLTVLVSVSVYDGEVACLHFLSMFLAMTLSLSWFLSLFVMARLHAFSFYVFGTVSVSVLVFVSFCDIVVACLYFNSMFLALSLSLSWSLSLFVMAQLNTCIFTLCFCHYLCFCLGLCLCLWWRGCVLAISIHDLGTVSVSDRLSLS